MASRCGGVAAVIINKESRRADKGLSSSLEVWRGTSNSSPLKGACYEILHRTSGIDGFFGKTDNGV